MPKIKIGTQLHYELSPLESMLEKSLKRRDLKLGPLKYKGSGLYRKFIFKRSRNEVIYEKGDEHVSYSSHHRKRTFPDILEIIKLFNGDLYRTNENILFRSKFEGDFGRKVYIKRVIFSNCKRQRFLVMPQGESGEELFTDAFNFYLDLGALPFSPEEVNTKEIREYIFDGVLEKSGINSIVKRKSPIVRGRRRTKLRDGDYVEMMVNYFCLRQLLPLR